jgi:hypothetical protein
MSGEIGSVRGKTESYWTQLPKVVVSHATFQKALSGDPSEAALAYPIQVYLGVKAKLITTFAEENHPGVGTDSKLGRPFQIDFVGIDRRFLGSDNPKWSWALETKLFDGLKRDRVVQDIVKLLLLAEQKQTENVQRYFLLLCPAKPAKSKLEFGENLKTARSEISATREEKSANLFDELLPWATNLQPQLIVRDTLHSQLRREFAQALLRFNAPKIRPSFKIKLISKSGTDDFVCGLWQILL